MPILLFGSEEQKQQWLPDLASGKKLAAFGLTEPDAGSDAGASRTRAELRDGEWVIERLEDLHHQRRHGHHRLRDDHRAHGRGRDLEPRSSRTGPRATRSPRRWTSSAGGPPTRESSRFSPGRARKATYSGRAAQGSSSSSRSSTAAGSRSRRWALGLAQGAYDLAKAYALDRQQFGKPIAAFQAIQFQLADMAVEIEAGRSLVYKAAWLKDEGREFALEAAMAKLYTGELSHRVVNHALKIHGGYGFMEESAIARLYRDQKILEIGEGTNEVQRMVIARHLGLPSSG